MADNDQSLYNIRYNQITQGMEGFGGGTPTWTPLALVADGGINQLTGDATAGPGTGSQPLTLATVNSNVGSFTYASLTVNAKGLITAASSGISPVTSVSGTAGEITSSGGTTPTLALATTVVTPGSYTNTNLTVDSFGRITAASSGSGGSGVTPSIYATSTTQTTTSSTVYTNTALSGFTFALSNSSHKVKISSTAILQQQNSGHDTFVSVFIDGSDIETTGFGFAANQNVGASNAGLDTVSFVVVAQPGDTASHTYDIRVKTDSGGSAAFIALGTGTALIEEIL